MSKVKILESDQEIEMSFSIMRQLRPHLHKETYVDRIRRMQQDAQYRLVAVFDNENMTALTGFRISENLAWGKYMYVDDLITDEKHRKKGYAQLLVDWLLQEAVAQHCQQLHLDSGVHRHDAHRFYLKNKMIISSHHFVTTIK